jgi:hypothetical protein
MKFIEALSLTGNRGCGAPDICCRISKRTGERDQKEGEKRGRENLRHEGRRVRPLSQACTTCALAFAPSAGDSRA